MRGKKPENPTIKRLKGTDKPAVASIVDQLPPPPWPLDKSATAHYRRLGALLIAKGRFAETFADALALYADSAALYCEARDDVRKSGRTVPGQQGGTKSNPSLTLRKDCWREMVAILAAFGCTPIDLSRLGVTETAPKSDRLAVFLEQA